MFARFQTCTSVEPPISTRQIHADGGKCMDMDGDKNAGRSLTPAMVPLQWY